MFKGIGVFPGISIGLAYLVDSGSMELIRYKLLPQMVEAEVERFRRAVSRSKKELEEIKDHIARDFGKEHQYIIDSHILMLEDEMLAGDTIRAIRRERVNAEWALKKSLEQFRKIFDDLDDEYLRSRKDDIDHIGNRVLRNLTGGKPQGLKIEGEPVIIVAHDLSPAETLQFSKDKIIGIATDLGGKTSHTSIMAKALEIPTVVGLKEVTAHARTGDLMLIDGSKGIVILNPAEEVLQEYKRKIKGQRAANAHLKKVGSLPATTRDGRSIQIDSNIEYCEEIAAAIENGAEGVGLYRTEYIYLNRKDLPGEQEHYFNYRRIAEAMAPKCAIIRTLDLGGERGLAQAELAPELRLALSLRAIRFSLSQVDIFKTQLKGILRASAFGKLKILYPMISSMNELTEANIALERAKNELKGQSVPFDEDIKVGVMIETPAAVVIADILAKSADFFSIGTNDLYQYALAFDRASEQLAHLYEPLHPYMLRAIRDSIATAHKGGKWVGVCGEMAADPLCIPLLVGFEADELSMTPKSIPRAKRLIRSISFQHAKYLAEQALCFETYAEIMDFVQRELAKSSPFFRREIHLKGGSK